MSSTPTARSAVGVGRSRRTPASRAPSEPSVSTVASGDPGRTSSPAGAQPPSASGSASSASQGSSPTAGPRRGDQRDAPLRASSSGSGAVETPRSSSIECLDGRPDRRVGQHGGGRGRLGAEPLQHPPGAPASPPPPDRPAAARAGPAGRPAALVPAAAPRPGRARCARRRAAPAARRSPRGRRRRARRRARAHQDAGRSTPADGLHRLRQTRPGGRPGRRARGRRYGGTSPPAAARAGTPASAATRSSVASSSATARPGRLPAGPRPRRRAASPPSGARRARRRAEPGVELRPGQAHPRHELQQHRIGAAAR